MAFLRLFDLKRKIHAINEERRKAISYQQFQGESDNEDELATHPYFSLSFVCAPPRMAHYIEVSTKIYQIYLRFVAKEDIHVYSIDEVFMDITKYLRPSGCSAHDFARRIIQEILRETKITATAGIGSNLYLAKVAMDIVAKHIPADSDGVRIAELTEMSYRRLLWSHRPLTDFWRVGRGYAKRLEEVGLYTMGDIARCSLGKFSDHYNEDLLYSMFGINAELLIDHAWGYEPCTMEDIKNYRPDSNSIGTGQALPSPYPYAKARLIVREMADALALNLVEKGLVSDGIHLAIGYDISNLQGERKGEVKEIKKDYHGRDVPKGVHAGVTFERFTSSEKLIGEAAVEIFDKICGKNMLVRRIYLTAFHVIKESEAYQKEKVEQGSLFEDFVEEKRESIEEKLQKEKRGQKAILAIKKKYGKNAILKGMDLQEGATAKVRNEQIGGHKA